MRRTPHEIGALVLGALALGCGPGRARQREQLADCVFNDDCASPLICAARRCRAQCRTDRDCRGGWRCLSAGVTDRFACYAPDDFANACVFDSQCRGGRVCGGDRVCRAQCQRDYDCQVLGAGLSCLSTGVCSRHPFAADGGAFDVDLNLLGLRGPGSADADAALRDLPAEAATTDAEVTDAGSADAESTDVISTDAGGADAESPDVTSADAGVTDAGTADAGCALRDDGVSCQPGTTGCDLVGLQTAVGLTGVLLNCALFQDGSLRCWGENAFGQLGAAGGRSCFAPGLTQSIHDATEIGVGVGFACVRRPSGVWCWGRGAGGALGNGSEADSATPVQVMAPTGTLVVGESSACVLTPGGDLWCWGQNNAGQLGDGTLVNRSAPTRAMVSGVRDVALGRSHACAVLTDGTVSCWGRNTFSALGRLYIDGQQFHPVPMPVSGITNAQAVSAGNDFTCVLLNDGTVRCWGINSLGTLGASGATTHVPRVVVGLTGVVELSSGADGSCARRADGSVWCWGTSYVLGDGSRTFRAQARAVPGITGARRISAGYTACAWLGGADLRCWGWTPGDGTYAARYTPAAVVW